MNQSQDLPKPRLLLQATYILREGLLREINRLSANRRQAFYCKLLGRVFDL
jgi:hypothetical protein